MTDSKADSTLTTTSGLLAYYSHEVVDQTQEHLLEDWLETYPRQWVRLALIEALYRGRYKTISVGELLAAWTRRGQPLYHFNREFEALICHNFPKIWISTDLAWATQQSSLDTQFSSLASPGSLLPTSVDQPMAAKTNPLTRDVDGLNQLSSGSPRQIPNLASTATLPIPDVDDFWQQGGVAIPSSSETSPVLETEASTRQLLDSAQQDDSEIVWEMKPRQFEITPIHQFTPNSESSGHFRKLAALVSDRS